MSLNNEHINSFLGSLSADVKVLYDDIAVSSNPPLPNGLMISDPIGFIRKIDPCVSRILDYLNMNDIKIRLIECQKMKNISIDCELSARFVLANLELLMNVIDKVNFLQPLEKSIDKENTEDIEEKDSLLANIEEIIKQYNDILAESKIEIPKAVAEEIPKAVSEEIPKAVSEENTQFAEVSTVQQKPSKTESFIDRLKNSFSRKNKVAVVEAVKVPGGKRKTKKHHKKQKTRRVRKQRKSRK